MNSKMAIRAMLRFSKTLSVDELTLQGGEEALGHGVVEAVTDRAHRALHPGGPAGFGEVVARVLTGFNRSSQHQLVEETLAVR